MPHTAGAAAAATTARCEVAVASMSAVERAQRERRQLGVARTLNAAAAAPAAAAERREGIADPNRRTCGVRTRTGVGLKFSVCKAESL